MMATSNPFLLVQQGHLHLAVTRMGTVLHLFFSVEKSCLGLAGYTMLTCGVLGALEWSLIFLEENCKRVKLKVWDSWI